jgi:hypothetical protein
MLGAAGAALVFGCGESHGSHRSGESTSADSARPSPLRSSIRTQLQSGGRRQRGNLAMRRRPRLFSVRPQGARTYLRGLQTTTADGQVTFTTIYPGWFRGVRPTSMLFVEELGYLRYRRACRGHVGCGRRWSTAATIDRASHGKPGCC